MLLVQWRMLLKGVFKMSMPNFKSAAAKTHKIHCWSANVGVACSQVVVVMMVVMVWWWYDAKNDECVRQTADDDDYMMRLDDIVWLKKTKKGERERKGEKLRGKHPIWWLLLLLLLLNAQTRDRITTKHTQPSSQTHYLLNKWKWTQQEKLKVWEQAKKP